MIGWSPRSVTGAIIFLVCVVAVARSTRLLDTKANSTITSSVVFGFCSSEHTVKKRVSHVKSWWQPQYNGLLLVDHIPDGLPTLPVGLHVQAADNKWKFINSAERCAWSQVSDTQEAFPQAAWYVLGDDDTFFIPQALESALSKFDASKHWYIGAPSESGKQNRYLGNWHLSNGDHIGEYAFGGGGIVISQALMQTLIPTFEQCLHKHSSMVGGDQRIGACVKILSPGTELTHFMGMHQVDSFHHNFDFLALFEAHPIQPLISLHHMKDIPLPGLGDLSGLRPYAKRNPYGVLQQSVCYSKKIGTLSIAAGLSVRWWDNNTDIKVADLIDYTRKKQLPPVTRYFTYAKSLNPSDNLRNRTISTWYAAYDSFNKKSAAANAFSKVQVEEAAGPGRWMAVNWDRLRCSHVFHNIADDSLHVVLRGPRARSA